MTGITTFKTPKYFKERIDISWIWDGKVKGRIRQGTKVPVVWLGKSERRHDFQHNDTQYNNTQHNDTQYNNTQQNDTSSTIFSITILSKMQFSITIIKNLDTHHNGTLYRVLLCWMSQISPLCSVPLWRVSSCWMSWCRLNLGNN